MFRRIQNCWKFGLSTWTDWTHIRYRSSRPKAKHERMCSKHFIPDSFTMKIKVMRDKYGTFFMPMQYPHPIHPQKTVGNCQTSLRQATQECSGQLCLYDVQLSGLIKSRKILTYDRWHAISVILAVTSVRKSVCCCFCVTVYIVLSYLLYVIISSFIFVWVLFCIFNSKSF